jgi:hypothetical protein
VRGLSPEGGFRFGRIKKIRPMASGFFAEDGIFSPPSNLKGEGKALPETTIFPVFEAYTVGAPADPTTKFLVSRGV